MILTKCRIDSVDLDQKIDDKIQNKQLNELLIIVPTNRKVRYLKKGIISSSPGQSAGKINLETIGTFAANLFFSGSGNGGTGLRRSKILSEAASSVLLKQSFQECSPKYFENNKDIPSGTLERIKNVISEYKKNGITPANLKRESFSLRGAEKIKAEDISDIYDKYQKKCDELGVKEVGDIYRELIQLPDSEFINRFRKLYPEVKLIVINGFDEFTIPEIDIINYSASIENSELFIYFDYYNCNPLVFSHLDKCYGIFRSKGFGPVVDKSKSRLNKFQVEIREKLFSKKTSRPAGNYQSSITRITAMNREKEIELIAKEIKDLIVEKGIEPHQICVAFNLIRKYSPVIRDIFSVYGLPYNLTDRYSLNTSSAVVSIINFLEILENDFYYKNIFRALSSGYLSTENVDLSNLLRASVNLKIISGLKNWIDSLTAAVNKPDNYEEEGDFSLNKEVFKNALDDILKLEEQLAPFNKKMTLAEFDKNLTDLIFSLGIHKKLINNDRAGFLQGSESIEKNIKAVTVFID
jgi:ATP-dependent helicase/nuclease subunit B